MALKYAEKHLLLIFQFIPCTFVFVSHTQADNDALITYILIMRDLFFVKIGHSASSCLAPNQHVDYSHNWVGNYLLIRRRAGSVV